jgi:hypothetical protein
MNSTDYSLSRGEGAKIKSANLNRNQDKAHFYSEKRRIERSSSINRTGQLRMPLIKIPEVEEEDKANQSRFHTNSGNNFRSSQASHNEGFES